MKKIRTTISNQKDHPADCVDTAILNLTQSIIEREKLSPTISFRDYLKLIKDQPELKIRNIFQLFGYMINDYVGVEIDEYMGSRIFQYFDTTRLLVEGTDQPFFPGRLFSGRLVKLAEDLKYGSQQNKLYIFRGPPGSGKSIFLNNLLKKFEEFTNTEYGIRYETVWRLNPNIDDTSEGSLFNDLSHIVNKPVENNDGPDSSWQNQLASGYYIDIPCPSHDNPILLIPKDHRRVFFDDLFKNDEFKWKLFTEKEYEWVLNDEPCTICSSMYRALLSRIENPFKVLEHVFAQPYHVNRKLGQGISLYSPGDKPMGKNIIDNPMFQKKIDRLLTDSNLVKFIYSHYACVNDGVYALMDIKGYNRERFVELHNIISEGIHKIENMEENTKSLFFILMNPEDEDVVRGYQSFIDRIEYIDIPYVIDQETEVEIYRNKFGRHIDDNFLPRVLQNFARVIISSRLNPQSEAILEWIGDPKKYRIYCDENLLLLKMEVYSGYSPSWLNEPDRKRLTKRRLQNIFEESKGDGHFGISGRDSIKIFGDFFSTYSRNYKLMNMSDLCKFFIKINKEIKNMIPLGFLDSLLRMYDYTILQEVKESLYYYNEEQIARDLMNYIFAINFEIGSVETCTYTGERLVITEDYLEAIEMHLLGIKSDFTQRKVFRKETQKEYTTKTLTQEILLDGLPITETKLYQSMHERYANSLKEKVLDPFLENKNFRQAIRDYDSENFKTYDKRIREDVTYLISNLCEKFRYTELGAKEICLYTIDNDLSKKFYLSSQ